MGRQRLTMSLPEEYLVANPEYSAEKVSAYLEALISAVNEAGDNDDDAKAALTKYDNEHPEIDGKDLKFFFRFEDPTDDDSWTLAKDVPEEYKECIPHMQKFFKIIMAHGVK